MKHTHRQTTRHTLTDLYRALDRQHAVTITYRAEETREVFAVNSAGVTTRRTIKTGRLTDTVRTVEIHDIRTTSDGHIVIDTMCRLRRAERRFYLSRPDGVGILTYTLHRAGHVLDRPEPTVYERQEPAPADSQDAIVAFELARDPDDADHRPRRRLTQTDTSLAA